MVRVYVTLAALIFPFLAAACESGTRHACRKQFRDLVAYRTTAIQDAFGVVFEALPAQIDIRFAEADAESSGFTGIEGYDAQGGAFVFPASVLRAKFPSPLRWARYYWPIYQNEQQRQEYPVIEAIDNVLWSAYLQATAKAHDLSWPHQDCSSVDVGTRLPCEMLIKGIAEHVKSVRVPMFNSNRMEQIWPEDFASFSRRVWRTDQEYLDVQRYGGIMLVAPLIGEFGIARALRYIAHTPFRAGNDLQIAAVQYQQRAREALTLRMPAAPRAVPVTYSLSIATATDR